MSEIPSGDRQEDQKQESAPLDASELIDDSPVTYQPTDTHQPERRLEIVPQPTKPLVEVEKGCIRPKPRELKSAFAEWLATPKHLRQPRTQAEFAKQHGVTDKTLSVWKYDPVFYSEYKVRAQQKAGYRMTDVMSTLADLGEAGNLDAVKPLMEASGWNDKTESGAPTVNLTLNQLIAQSGKPTELPTWYQLEVSEDGVG